MECSIVEYYEMLKNHDWYYDFTEDDEVWKKGTEEREHLRSIASEKGLDYERMWKAFNDAMFSGEPWGTEKVELPRLNEFI